jgi:tRNA(Ile)-lysidine synthase TilS/MesJ
MRKRSTHWIAICIDLNLAVQADSSDKARQLLSKQIHSYIIDALTIDAIHAETLLKRSAPWRYKMLYRAMTVLNAAYIRLANITLFTVLIPLTTQNY